MLIWFLVLGVLGLWQIAEHPGVLAAINPIYAYRIIADQGLASSGPSVRSYWRHRCRGALCRYGPFRPPAYPYGMLSLVMPGLLLNYFGQGALIISNPEQVHQVFFAQVPQDYIIALVVLSTLAAVIASQAVITGVFSLTRQAIQLGFLPRMEIRHTSETAIGQIYISR